MTERVFTVLSGAPIGLFERYPTVWVFLCIVTGIALGQPLPGVFQADRSAGDAGGGQGRQFHARLVRAWRLK